MRNWARGGYGINTPILQMRKGRLRGHHLPTTLEKGWQRVGNLNWIFLMPFLDPQAPLLFCEILSAKSHLEQPRPGFWLPPKAPSPPHQFPQVFCDLEANGGGWTLIQRRENGSVNFQRNWKDYKQVTWLPWGGVFHPWNLGREVDCGQGTGLPSTLPRKKSACLKPPSNNFAQCTFTFRNSTLWNWTFFLQVLTYSLRMKV